jgi:hypothetical protein
MNPDGTNVKITNAAPISGFNSDYLNFSWNTSEPNHISIF